MKIVSESINEMAIKHLSPKSEAELEKYFLEHPAQAISEACKIDNLSAFIKFLEKGVKLSASHIKMMYDYPGAPLILKWLKENQDKLSKYNISEKLIKDIKRAMNIVLLPGPKEYPKGYKQWRVLNFIKNGNGVSRTECVQLIFELGYGPGSFNPFTNASYWSTNFYGVIGKYTEDTKDGMKITKEGIEKIKQLDKRFKNLEIDAYV